MVDYHNLTVAGVSLLADTSSKTFVYKCLKRRGRDIRELRTKYNNANMVIAGPDGKLGGASKN